MVIAAGEIALGPLDLDHACACLGKAPGCTDPAAVNYNSRATFDDGTCKPVVSGCGHPLAINYDSAVTTHTPAACVWYNSPPPSPPLPPLNPGGTTTVVKRVLVSALFAEDVSTMLQQCRRKGPGWNKASCFGESLQLLTSAVRFRTAVKAGSAIVETTLDYETDAAADSATTTFNDAGQMATLELDGLSAPTSLSATRTSDGSVSINPIGLRTEGSNAGAIAGGVVGAVVFLLIVAVLVALWIYKGKPSLTKKKRASVTPGE
jgi:hypothetical protein